MIVHIGFSIPSSIDRDLTANLAMDTAHFSLRALNMETDIEGLILCRERAHVAMGAIMEPPERKHLTPQDEFLAWYDPTLHVYPSSAKQALILVRTVGVDGGSSGS